MKRNLCVGAMFLSVTVALGFGSIALERKATVEAAGVQAPRFEVDPLWPKPLPNNWILGQVAGIATDKYDRIWVVQRPRTLTPRERTRPRLPMAGERARHLRRRQ